MRHLIAFFVIMLLLSSLMAVPLRILYTNDTHGAVNPVTLKEKGKPTSIGGYLGLEKLLNEQRHNAKQSLYLDAGDQQTGSAFAALPYEGMIGGAVLHSFGLLGLQATVPGNHEFDQTQSNTLQYFQKAPYPYVCANLIWEKDNSYVTGVPYKIFQLDSLRVAVTGLTMTSLPAKVKMANLKGIRVLDYQEGLRKIIKEMDDQSDLIILLTHIGDVEDSLLAMQLDNRVDMIIGGHSHTFIDPPKQINNILVMQTGSYLRTLGSLDIDVKNDRIESWASELLPIPGVSESSTELGKFVSNIQSQLKQQSGKVIGYLETDWIPDKYKETELSRWQAEQLLEMSRYRGVDLAVINCGGLRKVMGKGEITLGDMQEMLPFGNTVTLFQATGANIKQMLQTNLESELSHEHDILQIAGLRINWKTLDGKKSIQTVKIHGKPIQDNAIYKIVSHDYITGQGTRYLGFEPIQVEDTGDLLLDTMIQAVIKVKHIK